MGPKMFTHLYIFIVLELVSQVHRTSVTHGRNYFVWFGHPHKILSVNAPITHITCLGIYLPVARTSVTQKNCFWTIFEIIWGLIANLPGAVLQKRYFKNFRGMGSQDPPVLKTGTESKFATGRKNRYGNSKTLRRVLRNACSLFPKHF